MINPGPVCHAYWLNRADCPDAVNMTSLSPTVSSHLLHICAAVLHASAPALQLCRHLDFALAAAEAAGAVPGAGQPAEAPSVLRQSGPDWTLGTASPFDLPVVLVMQACIVHKARVRDGCKSLSHAALLTGGKALQLDSSWPCSHS